MLKRRCCVFVALGSVAVAVYKLKAESGSYGSSYRAFKLQVPLGFFPIEFGELTATLLAARSKRTFDVAVSESLSTEQNRTQEDTELLHTFALDMDC